MKNTILTTALFAAALILSVPHVSAQASRQQQKDSLRNVISLAEGKKKLEAYRKLASAYIMEARNGGQALDTLLAVYDDWIAEAARQDEKGQQGMAMLNRLNALSNAGLHDEVLRQAPRVLDFLAENERWGNYYNTAGLVSTTYRRLEEYERALAEAEKTYAFAKEHGHDEGMGMALYSMANIYMSMRRFPEAEESLRESIPLLETNDSYLNILPGAYNLMLGSLVGQERYDEALRYARQNEEVNRRYEAASGLPQPSAWYNLWIRYVNIYRQNGEIDKAQLYVDKIDSISGGGQKMYKERGHILWKKKRYSEALAMLDKAIETSPLSLEPNALKVMVLAEMGEGEKAGEVFRGVITGLDSLYSNQSNARLDELRTQYEVEKHIAQKERNRNYFLSALGGCALLLLLLGVAFRYNRIVTRKNRNLYRRIKEQDRLEEELAKLKESYEKLSAAGQEIPGELAAILPGDKQQRELVARLDEYLLADGNLTGAGTGRDDLASTLGTNTTTLSKAVKAVTGNTLMDYIRRMQLDEARRRLNGRPELTIEAIAADCGFNTRSTFYNLFRKHYGISPAEYRKMSGPQDTKVS